MKHPLYHIELLSATPEWKPGYLRKGTFRRAARTWLGRSNTNTEPPVPCPMLWLFRSPPPRLRRYETQEPLGKHVLLAKTYAAWHRLLLIKAAKAEEIQLIQRAVAAANERAKSAPPPPPRGIWSGGISDLDVNNLQRIIASGASAGRSLKESEVPRSKEDQRPHVSRSSTQPLPSLPAAPQLPPPGAQNRALSSVALHPPPSTLAMADSRPSKRGARSLVPALDTSMLSELSRAKPQSWLANLTHTFRMRDLRPKPSPLDDSQPTPPISPESSSESSQYRQTAARMPEMNFKLTGLVTTDDDGADGCADAPRLDRREDCFFYIANGKGNALTDAPARIRGSAPMRRAHTLQGCEMRDYIQPISMTTMTRDDAAVISTDVRLPPPPSCESGEVAVSQGPQDFV